MNHKKSVKILKPRHCRRLGVADNMPENQKIIMIDLEPSCPFQTQNCQKQQSSGHCCLNNLKVALVGGLDRLEHQYRHAFKSLGVKKFYFHTGCCAGGGAERLRSATEVADIVVYLTRVNSHNAMSIIKGVCKKSGKSFIALRETGPDQVSKSVLASILKNV